ncbi:MAG: aquaporin Z [Hyphomicrobiaceae bacterium]
MRELTAEFVGTFMLVSAVCGAALFSAAFPEVGSGILGVSFAVGLTVLAMAYAVGHISGGHFNPAVTIGLWAAGKFETSEIPRYVAAQVAGGAMAALIFYIIASGKADIALGNFASNGYGSASPGGFSWFSAFVAEVVVTALFLIVIVGATSGKAPAGFAPIAIGLALAAFHLMTIPVSNASLNPARSTATALFGGGTALAQLWLFWVAPILGGVIGGVVARFLQDD